MKNDRHPQGIWTIIGASSVGTLIEWYDFYIFGSLATIISEKFFPPGNPTAAFLATLATFAAGFIVRPFGALVFGRLGDMVGRKYTFLLTLIIMGGSTFLIGLVPEYRNFSLAPGVILLLRLLQGLALGGEYGGAATYVAEHAPASRRGFYTSWIQTTATLGLFVSLLVILGTQNSMSRTQFNSWGWRIPFLLSVILVIISIIIRLRMRESPLFTQIKESGKISSNPLRESFGHKLNLKMVLLALFGATMGQGVIWYSSQFYAQTFLLKTCLINSGQANTLIGIALLIATPFFVVFGALSDRWGRKWIMMTGMLLAILLYRPIFGTIYDISDVRNKTELPSSARHMHQSENGSDGLVIRTSTDSRMFADGTQLNTITTEKLTQNLDPVEGEKAKVTKQVFLTKKDQWKITGLVVVLVLFVTMVYGPIAAFLVELFPTRIRYTSMSLPYHIGNGVFGGLVPFIGTLIVEYSKTPENPAGHPLAGLWYPIAIAAACFIIGSVYLSNRIDRDVSDETNVYIH